MEVVKKIFKKAWDIIKKILGQLWLLLDSIKGFLIVIGIAILILFLGSMITHNVLRFEEISIKYTGEYKKLYVAKDGMMNVYVNGGGNQTILIMSGFGVSSPTLEYKALADELGKEYKVIIVEYPGTGFSLSTKDQRSNKNIVEEVRAALKSAEINGPYILMPFDISNIYAMYYAENYPDEVSAIVSIDGMYPKAINKDSFKDDYLPNYISNVKFHSIIGFTGLYRWETYLYPEKYNIDKLENNDSYKETEIKIYRRLLANKYLTKEMRNQLKYLENNMKEMLEYEYSENLPVVQIVLNDRIDEYQSRGENLKKYVTDVVTNPTIQKTRILDKDVEYYLFENTEVILNSLKNDLNFDYDSEEDTEIIE